MLNPAAKRVRRHRERVFLFAKHAQRITACQRKGVNSIIECGRLLIAAKDELKHGEFLKMVENNLPFKRSTAQALMRIAADRLSQSTSTLVVCQHIGQHSLK